MTTGTCSDFSFATMRCWRAGSDQWPPNVTTIPPANARPLKK
jgi:hypothetical protein